MNTILLHPTDVLFFRDGRPMTGSHTGHTAAWPTPDITDHALHAALHRSESIKGHSHRRGRSGKYSKNEEHRDRQFGSLTTAGPFPVRVGNEEPQWFFPRPQDLLDDTLAPALLPCVTTGNNDDNIQSSLKPPLRYAAANSLVPSKENKAKAWLSVTEYAKYLNGETGKPGSGHALDDTDIADTEHTIGIAIDPDTQTTGQGAAEGQIYSAHYLRLREEWRLGLFANSAEKVDDNTGNREDILEQLIPETMQIIIGGQQRACTAQREKSNGKLPMPLGQPDGFESGGRWLVKWILLTPAIWPELEENGDKQVPHHPGGWLPNWIHPKSGQVQLKNGETKRGDNGAENRIAWRKRIAGLQPINAHLVSAVVPKPLVITGWATADKKADRPSGGAKSTHLAVPAGAVYYFEADSEDDARALANALNWHGDSRGTEIQNRRSTLLGEKGYGLGVCGKWGFYPTSRDVPNSNKNSNTR